MSDNEEEMYATFRAVFGGKEEEQPSGGADGEKEMEASPHDNEMDEEIYAVFRAVFGEEEAEQPSRAAEEEAEQPSRATGGEEEAEQPSRAAGGQEEAEQPYRAAEEEAEQPSRAAEGDRGVRASGWRKWEIEEENDIANAIVKVGEIAWLKIMKELAAMGSAVIANERTQAAVSKRWNSIKVNYIDDSGKIRGNATRTVTATATATRTAMATATSTVNPSTVSATGHGIRLGGRLKLPVRRRRLEKKSSLQQKMEALKDAARVLWNRLDDYLTEKIAAVGRNEESDE